MVAATLWKEPFANLQVRKHTFCSAGPGAPTFSRERGWWVWSSQTGQSAISHFQPVSASFSHFQPLSATLQPAWATFDPFSHFVRATFAQMCEAGAAALCEVPKRYSVAAKTWISFQSRKCNRLFWAKGCRSSTKWHCCKSSIGCKCCRSSTSDTVAEVAMVAKVA